MKLHNNFNASTQLLREINLFAEICNNTEAMNSIVSLLQEKYYEAGTAIIQEGEAGTEMFFLVSGKASVYKSTAEGEPYKVAIFDGTHPLFFGEGALLDADARSATIKADSPCHCLILKREAFEKFSAAHPEWALPILQRIARGVLSRLKQTNHDLSLLYHALVAEIRGR